MAKSKSVIETVHLEVVLDEDTVWLTHAQMVELFPSSKANISEHIKHIFEECEADKQKEYADRV
jgi:hypothetical protein